MSRQVVRISHRILLVSAITTKAQFLKTMHRGKLGARQISGIMPWWFFGQMTDDDLKYLFAYLRTLKPVQYRVQAQAPWRALNEEHRTDSALEGSHIHHCTRAVDAVRCCPSATHDIRLVHSFCCSQP